MTMWNKLRLRSRDPQVRLAAIEKLQTSSSEDVIGLIGETLSDEDSKVRSAAAFALGTGKKVRALQILLEALVSASPETRAAAAEGLGIFGEKRTSAALAARLSDSDQGVRASAAKALCQMKWVPASPEQRATYERALGRYESSLARSAGNTARRLRPARRSTDASLELLLDAANPEPYASALNDPDPLVRVAAIHALGKEAHGEEIALLLHSAMRDMDHRVRLAAAQVLSTHRNVSFTPTFLSLLKDSNFEVRLAAVRFLRGTCDRRHVPLLVTLLADKDNDVRQAAAEALSELGCPTAIEGLVLALSDEEKSVRQAAELALSRTDHNWMQSEAARRASKKLEALLDSRPSWVRAAMSHVVAKLQEPDKALGAAA